MSRKNIIFSLAVILMVVLVGWVINISSFPLPKNAVLLDEKGNSMWYNRPAISADKNNLYAGWMTSNRKVVVAKIDRKTLHIKNIKHIHTWHYLSDHGSPVVHIIQNGPYKGRLVAIYSLHNSEIYFQRTKEPGNIDKWESKKVINKCECTYPTLLENKGVLYLFYRKMTDPELNTRSYFLMKSKDFGNTWDKEQEIISANDGEWIYAMVNKDDHDNIHIVWGVTDPKYNDLKNIYYAISSDKGISWKSKTGAKAYSKILSTSEFLIYQSPKGMFTRVWDFTIKKDYFPALLYVNYENSQVHAYWLSEEKDKWLKLNLGLSSYNYYPCGLVFNNANAKSVYIAKPQENNVSTIYELEIDPQKKSVETHWHINNQSKYDYCRPISNTFSKDLIFTAVKSYKNFMKFDTAIIGVPVH